MQSNFRVTRREALAGIGGASAIALSGCTTLASAGQPGQASALLDDIAWRLLAHSPTSATALGLDVGEHAAMRGRLGDRSAAGDEVLAATLRADLARVRSVDLAALDPATRTSFEVVQSAYSTALEGFALPYGETTVGGWRNSPYAVIQNVGGYIDFPRFMTATQPVRDSADAEYYLERLASIPAQLDGELERIRAARAIGVVPPRFLLDKAIAAMKNSIADARTRKGAYVDGLARRTDAIPGNWEDRAFAIASGPIAAALERQLAELEAERAVADMDPGVWSQPEGDEWYAWALRAATTTRLSPEEIHAIGLAELEDIHARMDPILVKLGYRDGPVGQRMKALGEDRRFMFAEGDPGRAEIMAFLHERLGWIKTQMPRAFERPVDPNMEIRRLPAAEEPGAPNAYGGAGSKDGKLPGRMWINLHTTDLHRTYTLPTLLHHEAIPGHVWQGEYSHQLPTIRSMLSFGAFSEGWALYAEALADELGAYVDHPEWRLGYLQDQAWRACRLIADTGLHHMRWTRQEALDLFVERNGSNPLEMASEVDRYCSWPGQACSYKIGHTAILRERARAEAALGGAFGLRAFNQAIVDGGNVPMDVLAKTVDRYIARAGA